MEFAKFKDSNFYNLFVSADETAWESNSYIMTRDRCLTSYTSSEIKEEFDLFNDKSLAKIKSFPCLFAYEKGRDMAPYIGYITNIKVRGKGVKFEFEKIKKLPFTILEDLAFELDIDISRGITELMHTHWTIKKVNLYEELSEEIPLVDSVQKGIKKPTVFISYCWSPKENKDWVENLVLRLENDGVNVLYDKKCLRPGQDMNLFMETLATNEEIEKVLIICNKDYVIKADSRQGGVGTESEIIIPQVYGRPMQNKIIPIIVERDGENKPLAPIYLASRYGIDLTPQNEENGYQELLEDIFLSY
ncbi:toll/interleukin-1 receptor domain-containing protein [Enterococcus faecalis]|uniref:toll/interleukin-1 receptor domain-containing protein n=1 Tax=Enterococcus faecalis TaxID=1351 RepID=UPI001927EE82|nr:toll/interleukin-1 receptor domain-containing protein [Enterococcus faecalis]EGO8089621.1 TIR domain-containing protein [Enterococcus faecalis]EGO8235532.1 TIR domain-containing protein [Enterococcus faecalis]EGO8503495.1 TIR domain-containing protein [Enterococcus faecalis]MCD5083550.1 toll/interleukin-1 receptor domain-containing protein [Enterococcus faecalis]MCU7779596.1 toll/interleukin-1 receptor domain-containing protein [Enterococcus faecalis]